MFKYVFMIGLENEEPNQAAVSMSLANEQEVRSPHWLLPSDASELKRIRVRLTLRRLG